MLFLEYNTSLLSTNTHTNCRCSPVTEGGVRERMREVNYNQYIKNMKRKKQKKLSNLQLYNWVLNGQIWNKNYNNYNKYILDHLFLMLKCQKELKWRRANQMLERKLKVLAKLSQRMPEITILGISVSCIGPWTTKTECLQQSKPFNFYLETNSWYLDLIFWKRLIGSL